MALAPFSAISREAGVPFETVTRSSKDYTTSGTTGSEMHARSGGAVENRSVQPLACRYRETVDLLRLDYR